VGTNLQNETRNQYAHAGSALFSPPQNRVEPAQLDRVEPAELDVDARHKTLKLLFCSILKHQKNSLFRRKSSSAGSTRFLKRQNDLKFGILFAETHGKIPNFELSQSTCACVHVYIVGACHLKCGVSS